MFTGIIEEIGVIKHIEKIKNNVEFTIDANFSSQLYQRQSIAINGTCLTVEESNNCNFKVTAIKETLDKTNLAYLKIKDKVNLEQALLANSRLDGHFVQGHIDQVGKCIKILDEGKSWRVSFVIHKNSNLLIVNKGSIAINGVSLTIAQVKNNKKSSIVDVAIIPYTYKNTTLKYLKQEDKVNIEFDILGKYISESYSKKI